MFPGFKKECTRGTEFLPGKGWCQHEAVSVFALNIVATDTKAYAHSMSKKAKSLSRIHEGHMKLIALLLYIAEQRQKSADTVEQLFRRLMLPRKD